MRNIQYEIEFYETLLKTNIVTFIGLNLVRVSIEFSFIV